jgi:hypothetical protein
MYNLFREFKAKLFKEGKSSKDKFEYIAFEGGLLTVLGAISYDKQKENI